MGVVETEPDVFGYAYKISFCKEIPAESLPQGCRQHAEHPAVVKYLVDDPSSCLQIGSIGPCSAGACGMTANKRKAMSWNAPAPSSGLDVTFTYGQRKSRNAFPYAQAGRNQWCENSLTVHLIPGSATSTRGAVTAIDDPCTYETVWELSTLAPDPPPPPPPPPVPPPPPPPLPPPPPPPFYSACVAVLAPSCGAARRSGGVLGCMHCAGSQQGKLHRANCSEDVIQVRCTLGTLEPRHR